MTRWLRIAGAAALGLALGAAQAQGASPSQPIKLIGRTGREP